VNGLALATHDRPRFTPGQIRHLSTNSWRQSIVFAIRGDIGAPCARTRVALVFCTVKNHQMRWPRPIHVESADVLSFCGP